jgi:hypothetical protein
VSRQDAAARRKAIDRRIGALKARILAIDHVVRGSLTERTKVCGNPGCRCSEDPALRHGPYVEWGRIEAGKRLSSQLRPEMARKIAEAIERHRELDRLLRRWEALSLKAIQAEST